MKKAICVLLGAMIIFAFAACDGGDASTSGNTSTTTATTTEATEE